MTLVGCGGGGSSSVKPAAKSAHVFATDDLNVGYDHVWVTIKRVALHSAAGTVVAFDDPAGKVVDLRTLRDASGARFLLLGTDAITAGTYTGVDVTLADPLVLFPTGTTTGTNATFGGSGVDKTIAQTFSAPATVVAGGSLVIDFDLAHWNLNNGVVTAPEGFLDKGDPAGIEDSARHERDDFGGSVSALTGTAPTQTFALGDVTVETSASTVLYDESGASTPTLINGERVEVRGVFDVASGHLVADSIKIENEGDTEHRPRVEGTVSAFDTTAGTVTVALHDCEGFLPGTTSESVVVNGTTTFFTGSGVSVDEATFFAALANGQEVRAQGSVDPTTGVLTATSIKIGEGEGGHGGGPGGGGNGGGHDAELQGGVLSLDATAQTFVVKAKDWEGLNVAPGTAVTVALSTTTRIDDFSDVASFLAALTAGTSRVEVKGTYDLTTSVLTATRVKLDR